MKRSPPVEAARREHRFQAAARVMWNRIVAGKIETGFVTLALHSTAA